MKTSKTPKIKVPILDLKAQYKKIGPEVRRAINGVLKSQQFILGSTVQKFEEECAAYLKAGAAVGCASGSDALLLSMMALGIGPGDGVLVPPFTFFATLSCITRLGAMPILIDIDPENYLLDAKKAEAFLEQRAAPAPDGKGRLDPKSGCRIRAILPVHLFGRACAMAPLLSLAERYDLRIVEDAAQAFGSRAALDGGLSKAVGTIGDLGCFSFFPTKNLGGMGDGGMVTTDKPELAAKLRMLRVHGASTKYHHEYVGLNSRLDALQAAALSVKLRYLDQWCEERIERARRYHSFFSESGLVGDGVLSLPALGVGMSHVFNQYVIRVQRRDELRQHLREQGIQTEVYYPLPLHLQPCFAFLGYGRGDFPNSELASTEVLALPIYPELAPESQSLVVQKIRDFFGK